MKSIKKLIDKLNKEFNEDEQMALLEYLVHTLVVQCERQAAEEFLDKENMTAEKMVRIGEALTSANTFQLATEFTKKVLKEDKDSGIHEQEIDVFDDSVRLALDRIREQTKDLK